MLERCEVDLLRYENEMEEYAREYAERYEDALEDLKMYLKIALEQKECLYLVFEHFLNRSYSNIYVSISDEDANQAMIEAVEEYQKERK
jgi:hypothetical protein